MKITRHGMIRVCIFLVISLASALSAFGATQEKDGMRAEVISKTLSRNDGPNNYYSKEINRLMTVKAVLKNIGFKDIPAGKVHYTFLIRRWALSEVGRIERVKGTEELPALVRAASNEMLLGEFEIGGHMHGKSDEHVDQFEGWQLEVEVGEKKIIFQSNAKFTSLNKLADRPQ